MITLKLTQGQWYNLIEDEVKTFDFRKGYREVKEDDVVRFVESDEEGNPTGGECFGIVDYVLHSKDFPKHFGWKGPDFTIIQFRIKLMRKRIKK